MSRTTHITPVILSGGAGTRLWPLSRGDRPKQLIALAGNETMLQATARRAARGEMFAAPLVVAGGDHADMIEEQLAVAGAAPAALIVEPCARGTAPAIALAALEAGEQAMLLAMPSDHVIADEEAFRAAMEAALPLADEDWLVTFGVAPERAETGYGYIERGAPLGRGVFQVERFTEKPDLATAEAYVAGGRHEWNAGIFLFRAGAYLRALEEYAPEILVAARSAMEAAERRGARVAPGREALAGLDSRSIDHAVMEKAARVAVAPVAMGWSDIGSWDALHALGPRDADGNLIAGDALAVDSRGCLIRSDGPVVVALGVSDLIIVATERAVLVVPRGESQRVKEALDALIARGKEE
jgi:mannose-1-phosphate guanylyltransferase/mannose-1-phosphate guanylyltransferase/mannose-6-phosphate isomerase